MSLNFEIEGIEERYRYSNEYRTAIMDASSLLENLNSNEHISVAPHSEGVQVTLRYIAGEDEWIEGNRIICLAENGQDGVSIPLEILTNFENGEVPSSKVGNLVPTATASEKTYIFPFTQKDKEYEFILAGPLNKSGEWQSEYVCCKANGGVGELINADLWNKEIGVTDIDYENYSFRVSGDVASVIDNSSGVFTKARLWTDVRAGVEGNDRSKTFGYASRQTCIIGDDEEGYLRTLEDLENPLLVENHPDFEKGELNEDDYNNEDVFEIISEYNNKFWVIITIQEIQLTAYPNIEFALRWK